MPRVISRRCGASRRRVVGVVLAVGVSTSTAGCSHTVTGSATPASVSSAMGPSTPAPSSELMAKVRAVDPCSVFDLVAAKQYGPEVRTGLTPLDRLNSCSLQASDGATVNARFRLTLGHTLDHSHSTRVGAGSTIEVGQPKRDINKTGDTVDTCDALVPSAVDKFGHGLHAVLFASAGQSPASGPQQACDAAKAMLTAAVPKLDRLDPVAPKTSRPTLYGKDPCGPLDQILHALPGNWRSGPITWFGPYHCLSVLYDPSSSAGVQVQLSYDRDAEQDPGLTGRRLNIAGLSGIEIHSSVEPVAGVPGIPDAGCMLNLTYQPQSTPTAQDAHLIGVNLHFVTKGAAPDAIPQSPVGGTPVPFNSCDEVERLAPTLVAATG